MPADSGVQQVTIKFYDAVDSLESNERFRDIRPTGVYAGGYLSKINDTTVRITPFVAEVQSKITTPYYQVKIETTATVDVTVGTSTPYVVIRWSYTGVANDDYAEMLGVASPDTRDVIIGECVFSGSTLTGFDYVERHTPLVMNLVCRVEPEETPSMYVRVRAGMVHAGDSAVIVADQLTSVLVAPGSGSKTGAVYIDDTGAIQVSSDFTWAGQLVLAEIALIQSQTQITAADITDVRAFLTPSAIPDDTTIRRDVTTGLLETVPHTHSQLHDESHTHAQLHNEEHTHSPTFKILWTYNPNVQCVEQSVWTKLAFSTVSKNTGIAMSNSQITLLANKAYNITYVAQFESTDSKSPRTRARLKVVSGDTSWDLEENTYTLAECGLGTLYGEDVCLTWSGWIIPNQNTVIKLEAMTRDEDDMDNWGQCRYCHINVYQSEVGAAS